MSPRARVPLLSDELILCANLSQQSHRLYCRHRGQHRTIPKLIIRCNQVCRVIGTNSGDQFQRQPSLSL